MLVPAGSPKIPEWGIPLPQYPSVSLLSWNTGYGNARYWVLKLLIEHFAPGAQSIKTKGKEKRKRKKKERVKKEKKKGGGGQKEGERWRWREET